MSAPALLGADAARYAQTSALASGKWAKIDISTPGLQTLSRQTLKNFGFDDPNKVYVYGYGGRMISEALTPDHPDDLPSVPVVRRSDGSLSFYAAGTITTKAAASSSSMKYDHTINPYSDSSYYFISDVAPAGETATADLSETEGMIQASTAVCQKVHEADLLQCAASGRDYLGEDFKSAKSQSFQFDLPDNAAGDARIRIQFGANATEQTSFIVSANGQRLPATTDDRIAKVTMSDQYYKLTTTVKNAEEVGNSLAVGIEYSQAGVVSTARLDWIEVEYERELKLRDSQLHFIVNPAQPTAYTISGASDQTLVWDVTAPWDIKEVKGAYDATSRTLTLGVSERGLREFMVFEPSAKGASPAGRIKISNQNIHAMPTPDMVIITPDEFSAAAEKIAAIHRTHDGMTVHVLSPEKIYNEFSSGNPDVSAFRKLLKMWYDRSEADSVGRRFGYCLLMGRPTYDQKAKNPETLKAKYPRTLIWQSATGQPGPVETSSYCTDDFITMLEDETTERSMAARKQLVAVGRYAVTSAYEAEIVASKLESYVTDPIYGIWRNNVMLIADDGDNANHLKQSQNAAVNLAASEVGQHYVLDRIYLDAFERKQTGSGLTFPEARDRMLMKWQKEGASYISYIGHANPKEWTHEKLLTWNDVNTMSNQYLPVLYAATCSFGKWDHENVSGAELMVTNPAGGAIAVITPSRTVFIAKNGHITNSISAQIFKRDSEGKGQRLGDIVRLGKNLTSQPDDNMLRYHLFGDPALRIPIPAYNIRIDSIAGQPLALGVLDAPTVKARSVVKVSGIVADEEGNPVPFNGPLQFTLFDAEKSIETNGWGEKGEVSYYQDRSSKLATGSAMVKDGQWSATILMPSEISNNYAPALLSLYAYDPTSKLEANGSTDRLYVYGYDSDSAEDTDGPTIESFSVASGTGSQTGAVHSNPVATAIISDESGINISDAGIGHKMSLTLDSGKVFDDISPYFIPDPEDQTKGRLAYPLLDLAPGDHTLKLTVWDNANNSSNATIDFKVGLNLAPKLAEIVSVYNRTTDQLTLRLATDRALCSLGCRLECFTLSGELLWSAERKAYAGSDSTLSMAWNLKDSNGHRLPRGIYMIRATVTSEDGLSTTQSKKIAIPAQ